MTASKYLIALLKIAEMFSPVVYKDSAGHPTIGYGHKLRPGEVYEQPIDEATAHRLLMEDLEHAQVAVREIVKVPITQGQYDALCSLTYNIGVGAIRKSGLIKSLNDRMYEDALRRLRMYVNVKQPDGTLVKSPGLEFRRKMESVFWIVPD